MSFKSKANLESWNRNTHLGVNLKTILRSSKRMLKNKNYLGMLCRDSDAVVDDFLSRDEHFTFIETMPLKSSKRNPHVFEGKYITITRRDDGLLRLNFKPLKTDDADFTVDGYALGVCNEISWALNGLVEEVNY